MVFKLKKIKALVKKWTKQWEQYRWDKLTDKARTFCKMAGLAPDLLGVHPNNAMVAKEAGNPWKEVNYVYVEKCLRTICKRNRIAY